MQFLSAYVPFASTRISVSAKGLFIFSYWMCNVHIRVMTTPNDRLDPYSIYVQQNSSFSFLVHTGFFLLLVGD